MDRRSFFAAAGAALGAAAVPSILRGDSPACDPAGLATPVSDLCCCEIEAATMVWTITGPNGELLAEGEFEPSGPTTFELRGSVLT